jgi:hypothetical protein
MKDDRCVAEPRIIPGGLAEMAENRFRGVGLRFYDKVTDLLQLAGPGFKHALTT